MKTEFRTIEIGKFIASIFVMFFMCLLLQRTIGFDADAIYYTLPFIALLYLIFRGKICFAMHDSELSICWVRRPFLCSFGNKIIEYSSIIYWKY
ncbi:hypothetical protein [Gramella sp. MAR_2010_147]|uniref:hypothetical protein n=1 Tax=Gramella sp. MAR_2010_147 TaxID=1250205 RepID=UPI000B7CA42D|nr:hypothetical protein [Gramella sp. MAR_2010_147]